jgi:hypothetical protein
MNSDFEKLVNNLLSAGELTERIRDLLLKKAESLGIDPIDFELELESRIADYKIKTIASANTLKSNKEGDVKKCPACGAAVKSFNSICSDCNHEFRNTDAVSSIMTLHKELQNGEEEERNKPRSWAEKLDGELAIAKAVANRQKSIISSFAVPNTKEDLLEFLSVASSEASKKLGFFIASAHPEAVLKNAWLAKSEQIIIKSRMTFKDDRQTLEKIEIFAKQLKIK